LIRLVACLLGSRAPLGPCLFPYTTLFRSARLRAISPQTHVIVITGHEDTAARVMAMQIGTVAFLIKPFDDEQFLEAVHRALGRPPESPSGKPPLSAPDLVRNSRFGTRVAGRNRAWD